MPRRDQVVISRPVRNVGLTSAASGVVDVAWRNRDKIIKYGRRAYNYVMPERKPKKMGTKSVPKKTTKIMTTSIKEFDSRKQTIVLSRKMPGKTKGKWTYTQIVQNRSGSAAGSQGGAVVHQLVGNNTFTSPSDPGFGNFATAIRLNDMNPYRATTGSQLFGAQIPQNDRFGLKSIDLNMELINGANLPVIVDFYFILHKTDNQISITNNWTDCLIAEGMGKAAFRFPLAGQVTNGAEALGGSLRANFPGQDPFRLSQFRKNFKLLKKTTVNLQVGVNELLKTKIIYNKVIQPNAHLGDKIKGITIEVLAVQRGIVTFDCTGTNTLPTYGSSLIGYVTTATYNMCAIYSNAGRLDTSFGATGIPYNAANGDQSHVDEGSELQTNFQTIV